jgi:hypothetical protein
VSLKAWTGDIDPYDSLDEMWIQISAIPPPPNGPIGKLLGKFHLLLASCLKLIGTLCLQVSLGWSGLKLPARMYLRFLGRDCLK